MGHSGRLPVDRRCYAYAGWLTMTELLRFLASHLVFLFESGRYRIVDSKTRGRSGDALIILESDSLRLRLDRDRSQMSLDVQPNPPDGEDWFGIGVFRRWLLGERPGFDHLDESAAVFLRDYLEKIETELFSVDERSQTLDRLRAEREARADERFGKLPPQ